MNAVKSVDNYADNAMNQDADSEMHQHSEAEEAIFTLLRTPAIRVAIDGAAGVGKSSTAKALAQRFGFAYFDTGAVYRAAAWWCLHHGVDVHDEAQQERITELVAELFTQDQLQLSFDPARPHIAIGNEDITEAIRDTAVNASVSFVSRIASVRRILIAAQRGFIAQELAPDAFSHGRGIVVEGRDITTVVDPQADVRVVLTARPEVRQRRRDAQLAHAADDVAKRDAADAQVTSFLTASEGVTTLDNSDLTFEQTLDELAQLVQDAIEQREYEQYAARLQGYELDDEDQALLNEQQTEHDDSASSDSSVGVLAVIGRPNVGKSTLVNRILGHRIAVVEDTPGVTRDRVSYDAEWAGVDFKLVDTGGWDIDAEGIAASIAEQAQIAIQLADAVVFVVDGRIGMTDADERLVRLLRAAKKPVVLAVNKIDNLRDEYMAADFWKLGLGEPYPISALHGRGIGDMLDVAMGALKEAEHSSGSLVPTHLRRVALVGRPNVGKSSLLNQLAHQERAVVNDLAGTTRDPIDEVVQVGDQDWLFIDTAGIKRRQHKLSGAEYYSSLRTQAAIERAELVLVLFDASVPIADQDLKVMSQAVDAGRAIVLVFNKWDLMNDFDRERTERLWKTEFDRVTWAQRVNLSAKTGWHTNRLLTAMNEALNAWDQRIPTGKLNAFLGQLQASHPHPLRGGKQARILFATQASARPPRFVIFATGFLEQGYRRFIERSLREEFGFQGTPIQISVKVRQKQARK